MKLALAKIASIGVLVLTWLLVVSLGRASAGPYEKELGSSSSHTLYLPHITSVELPQITMRDIGVAAMTAPAAPAVRIDAAPVAIASQPYFDDHFSAAIEVFEPEVDSHVARWSARRYEPIRIVQVRRDAPARQARRAHVVSSSGGPGGGDKPRWHVVSPPPCDDNSDDSDCQ